MRWNSIAMVVCLILTACSGASARVIVNVSTPANNATLTSPFLLTASATSNKRITGWSVSVDGTSVFQAGATNSISTSISMAAGTHQIVVQARANNGQSGSVTLTETVASSPTGTAQGTVTPTSLAFGSIAINTTSSSQTVTVKNTGTATLNITGVSISPSQFAVSGPSSTSVAPGSSAAYSVTFKPTATAAYSGTLSFTTNSATAVAPVTLSGTGMNSTPTPTPTPTPNPTPTPTPTPVGNASCSGTTYYVSNSGNDSNSGVSTSSPWKTVAHVVASEPSLRAGDCVLFQRGGIWSEQLTISNVHGTQTNPITFGNYGTGNLPVLDGGSTRLYGIVDGETSGQIASSYITIDGFEVRNTTMGGIIFSFLAQPGITIQNNYVHNNGYGAYAGACSGCFQVDDGHYGYNEGIAFVGYPNASYGAKILNNIVKVEGGHNAVMVDMDLGNPIIQGNQVGPGCSHGCIDFKRSVGMLVKDNIVNCSVSVTVNGQTYPGCNATSLYTEQDDTSYVETGTYEHNVVYGAANGYACFGANGATTGLGPIALKYYNNTCYTGSTGANPVTINSCFGGNLTFENNIFAGGGGGIYLGSCSVSTWDYNDKYGASGGPSGAHDMNVDPLFVNPGTMDFHLQSGSPLLNSGNSNILGVPYIGACGTSGTCP
jgi:Abnormal spindle-like microcephaly-assoc'd, ASPM-SPD-2-Hydin